MLWIMILVFACDILIKCCFVVERKVVCSDNELDWVGHCFGE